MLPIQEHGFTLHKGAFRDALCLLFDWQPHLLPSNCVCGNTFFVENALNCPCGQAIHLFDTMSYMQLCLLKYATMFCLQPLLDVCLKYKATNVADDT